MTMAVFLLHSTLPKENRSPSSALAVWERYNACNLRRNGTPSTDDEQHFRQSRGPRGFMNSKSFAAARLP